MKKFAVVLLLFAGVWMAGRAQADPEAAQKIRGYLRNVATYSNRYLQEKVYLHLDANGYVLGDTIWFKAYVMAADQLLPTPLSSILYAELLTSEGALVERKILPVINGRTYGDFSLGEVINSGFYEVRAYTRAMLNWDAGFVYSRVVPVYSAPKEGESEVDMTLAPVEIDTKVGLPRTEPAALTTAAAQKTKKHIVTFYPEGGNMVEGLPARIAYKLTDETGLPSGETLRIVDVDGTTVLETTPVHEGMGVFSLESGKSGLSATIEGEKKTFDLPAAVVSGCTMTAEAVAGGLRIGVRASGDLVGKTLGVSVTQRSQLYAFAALVADTAVVEHTFQYQSTTGGIQQVTLFTDEGEVLAERLVWMDSKTEGPRLTWKQNKTEYSANEPIALEFELRDAQGLPLQGEFSLSVQDADRMLRPDAPGLTTDMLLCSDLKGYIHDPDFYLDEVAQGRTESMDLLLLVQGWRRYAWREMSDIEPVDLVQPAEDMQVIDGRIVGWSKKEQDRSDTHVNLMIMQGREYNVGTAVCDEDGAFAIAFEEAVQGDCIGYFEVTKNDKRQRVNVALNRGFSPTPRAYEPVEMVFSEPEAAAEEKSEIESYGELALETETFEWVDTFPKVRILPEAHTEGKRVNRGDAGLMARFTWLGGEATGKRLASVFYNINEELTNLLDTGEGEPYLWEWLEKKNKHFEAELVIPTELGDEESPSVSYTLTYRGRPVVLRWDNAGTTYHDAEVAMSEVKSLAICDDPEAIQEIAPTLYDSLVSSSGRQPVLFLLYTSQLPSIAEQTKKGVRSTILHGYSYVSEFHSPNYRTESLPDPTDMRRTLYWDPALVTNEQGRCSVVLFNNATDGNRIHVNAQGIAANGRLFGN